MTRFTFLVLFILAIPVLVFAQGTHEYDKNGNAPVDGFTPREIKKYSNSAGNTKILIPLATNVRKYCIQPTAASGIRYGTTGDQKAVAANAELCRSVRKGITQLQYSSTTSGTVIVELDY